MDNKDVLKTIQTTSINDDIISVIKEKIKSSLDRIQSSIKHVEQFREHKEELKALYEKYGELGWTIPESIDSFWLNDFSNEAEADCYMNKYCDKESMTYIFNRITNDSRIASKDVYQAIKCYRKKLYKPSVLTLFSLIDGFAISIQSVKEGKRRSVKSAKNEIITNKINNESLITEWFILNNVACCVDSIYKDADDFKIDCSEFNRNTISHGMLNRPVSKTDCNKAFLLLYNLLLICEDFEIIQYNTETLKQ